VNPKALFSEMTIIIIFILLEFIYFFLPRGISLFPYFSLLISTQFFIYFFLIFKINTLRINIFYIIFVAILARLILIYSPPVLENDYWRYLWDGRVLANGINPYLFKPLDPALNFLNTEYRKLIGFKQFGTIYPPFSIYIFALNHKLFPDSLISLKFILTLFDIGTGLILIRWLREIKISEKWSLLYFFNPLIMKEISNSAHLDSIAVFFTFLAAFLFWKGIKSNSAKTISISWIILAIATASKLYPICIFPLFFKIDTKRWRNFAYFSVALILLYFPFLSAGISSINGTQAFAQYWIFNSSIFKVIQQATIALLSIPIISSALSIESLNFLLKQDRLAKVIVGIIFTFFVFWRTYKIKSVDTLSSEIINILGMLLILSPVVNGWYVLWILPFACLNRNVPWLAFSYLVIAGYAWWFSKDLSLYLKGIEYVIFFGLLFLSIKNKRQVKNNLAS
jgi:alpha-1,6-mannosyltransferase